MPKPIYDIGQICELDKWESFIDGQPFDLFKRLRQEAPIYWHEESLDFEPGFWALTKHEDIVRVSKDPLTFSSAAGGHLMSMGDPAVVDPSAVAAIIGNMIGMDPPDHQIYRKMVAPSFTPKAIRNLESDMRLKIRELLENVEGKSDFNFVTEISEQLPLWVLCEMMGIPESDRPKIRDLVNNLTDASIQQDPENAFQIWVNYMELFKMGRDMIEERRKNPTDDLMSVVANTKIEGGELPPELLDGFFLLMVIAGNETTRNTLTGGIMALTENPEERNKLLKDPSLISNATDEMLRWVTSVIYFRRTAMKDTNIRGQDIKKGDKVVMWYGSANRDEDIFTDGDLFRVDRENAKKHLAFGAGEHLCLGNRLGHMQIRILFEELLARFPNIHTTSQPVRIPSNFLAGISDLKVSL
ncbi:cytochrome P450 [Gammaproteobacteria bacterium]|nr:cytochrome P450 [Gammaproteobacteria bacterium]MDB3994767.1 cytochrome P450 [Gammaproteobacteria bacterium]MDB4815920.1 cytochrome P450 [Gammaproteobacteria bacterium]MDC0577541.1 cytochrome P450 [Gammaproteobacteria bacterium]